MSVWLQKDLSSLRQYVRHAAGVVQKISGNNIHMFITKQSSIAEMMEDVMDTFHMVELFSSQALLNRLCDQSEI